MISLGGADDYNDYITGDLDEVYFDDEDSDVGKTLHAKDGKVEDYCQEIYSIFILLSLDLSQVKGLCLLPTSWLTSSPRCTVKSTQ